MGERIFLLAKSLGRVGVGDEERLRALCTLAELELTGRLREGVEAEACGGAFAMGAAWLALAGLCAGERVESFTAGGLTVRQGSGQSPVERAAALREQCERVMMPYISDSGFSFLGVRG